MGEKKRDGDGRNGNLRGSVGMGVISVPVQVSGVYWSGSRLPNCVFR